MRENIQSDFAGAHNRGKALLLDSSTDVKPLDIQPDEAELLESRKFSVAEIARLFNIPPPLLADYQFNTFTNAETASRWFGMFTLSPWCKRIEAAFTRLMLPRTMYLELDLSDYLRADSGERWAAYATALEHGVLTPEEVKQLEGWSV
jgi:HK97 family phage portal protein